MINDFIKAVLDTSSGDTVTALFDDGEKVVYTMAMVDLLKTDSTVIRIMDNQTGV